jgi:hypothetical protein
VNRQPFSTLLSTVSRPKPPLVRDSEGSVPEQRLRQGARGCNRAGPMDKLLRNRVASVSLIVTARLNLCKWQDQVKAKTNSPVL